MYRKLAQKPCGKQTLGRMRWR